MRRTLALVAIGCILSGCAHTHRVDPARREPDLEAVNRAVRGRQASVELVGAPRRGASKQLPAEGVTVGTEFTSLTLLSEPSGVQPLFGRPGYAARRDTTTETASIASLSVTSRSRGALDGGLLGLAVGTAVGALLGLRIDDPASDFERASFGGFFGAIFGTGLGLTFGVGLGSTHVFEFDHERQARTPDRH